MKIIFKISLLTSFVYLVGCSGGNTDNTNTEDTESTPSQVEQSQTTMPDPVPVDENSNTEVALNPPHGEPGHVCDIPVGAPLNSTPATSDPANNQTQSTPVEITPQEGSVAEGTNPPHGEPGHDCNIPVGAPLNKE